MAVVTMPIASSLALAVIVRAVTLGGAGPPGTWADDNAVAGRDAPHQRGVGVQRPVRADQIWRRRFRCAVSATPS
jgi:hypothetical protein